MKWKVLLRNVLCATVAFTTWGLLAMFFTWMTTPNPVITINIDVKEDRDFGEYVAGRSCGGLEFEHKNDGADVLIRSHSDSQIDGYTKLENALTSTIVMMVPTRMTMSSSNSAGFAPITSRCYRIDLTEVLKAIENDATWESIGVSKEVADGKVSLIIPNENCSYYSSVIDTLYYALNNFNPLTDEARETLKPRLDAIVAKCKVVPDIFQSVVEACNMGENTNHIFLGPEYLLRSATGYTYFTYSDSSKYYMVYFHEHITFTADIYIKEYDDSASQKEMLDEFVNALYEKSDFNLKFGWRITDAKYDVSSHVKSFMYNDLS